MVLENGHQLQVSAVGGPVRVGALIIALFISACGSGSSWTPNPGDPIPDPGLITPARDIGDVNSLENLIYTDAFAGKLVVHLDESLGAQYSAEKGIDTTKPNKASTVADVQRVIEKYSTVTLKPSVDRDPEDIKASRAKLEKLSGKKLADWNAIYHLDVADRNDAVRLLRELKATAGVTKVYPRFKASLASLETTPSLTGLQGYLESEEATGGLNARAAWDAGVRGEGVEIFDAEHGVNHLHSDLGMIDGQYPDGGGFFTTPACAPGYEEEEPDCEDAIAHGTAIMGILGAKENDHGVTGFAPDARLINASITGTTYGSLSLATNNSGGPYNIPPGSIWVIEAELPGRYYMPGGDPFSEEGQRGLVPTELWPEDFAAIQQATAYGVTVVAGAGDGSMNLNDPTLYQGEWSFAHNLATEDAGSIMVGAAYGAEHDAATWSNCGSRVNAYAWGTSVVTTGYPGPYTWTRTSDPFPPNDDVNAYFIDTGGGTSATAAMVGGAAALVQGYAKQELGEFATRYLMPSKMREVIVESGVSQNSGECNIGTQPRIDVAMGLVDDFLADVAEDYPELASGDELSETDYLNLRAQGVGLICKENDEAASDASCPDSVIWPAGKGVAKTLDFDGDGRADLVSATNGLWKVDLSSVVPSTGSGSPDNYGAWDATIDFAPIAGRWVWPYTLDINADGRTDVVMYDKENGTWHVAYTTRGVLEGDWDGWDETIDYAVADTLELDPDDSMYCRPVPGDYNGDRRVDLAVACSDGYWKIDLWTADGFDEVWDYDLKFLTDAQLTDAPGWAYLPIDYPVGAKRIMYKCPDGVDGVVGGRLVMHRPAATFDINFNFAASLTTSFGGNDSVPMAGIYEGLSGGVDIALKNSDGSWQVVAGETLYQDVETTVEDGILGGIGCHPIAADFDGDGENDPSVFCPDGWKINYSSEDFEVDGDGVRSVAIGYNTNQFVMPGRVYFGGLSYTRVQQLIRFSQALHPETAPPIPVDMVSVGACLATPEMSCE